MTIYNLLDIINTAHKRSMTPKNIITRFKKCGIYSFDRNVFSEKDFAPSTVTDREFVSHITGDPSNNNLSKKSMITVEDPGTTDNCKQPRRARNLASKSADICWS